MPRGIVTTAVTAATMLAILSGCSTAEQPPQSSVVTTTENPLPTMTGTVTALRSGDFHFIIDQDDLPLVARNGDPCGYGDIRDTNQEAEVIIRDSNGQIIGAERFDDGALIGDRPGGYELTSLNWYRNETRAWFDCAFPLSVPLSAESSFYTITVGGKDEYTYSSDEFAAANWILDISLGS